MRRDLSADLSRCVCEGDLDGVRRLLSWGADIHTHGDWALRLASENGHAGVVAELIKAGADIYGRDCDAFRTACICGKEDVVEVFFKSGSNFDAAFHEVFPYVVERKFIGVIIKAIDNGVLKRTLQDYWLQLGGHDLSEKLFERLSDDVRDLLVAVMIKKDMETT